MRQMHSLLSRLVLLGLLTTILSHQQEGVLEQGDVSLLTVAEDQTDTRMLGSSRFQPRITQVETLPARKEFGSVSLESSPWCDGARTVWFVGHQRTPEKPWCEIRKGLWKVSKKVELDRSDPLNKNSQKTIIDRHDCAVMDVNRDKKPDLLCSVGADSGKGKGFNEVYLTQNDGSLKKVLKGHGLHKYPYMRNRYMTVLKGRGDSEFVFFATKGVKRTDGNQNTHRMFENVYKSFKQRPWFKEVKGPWTSLFEASCAVSGDFDRNGLDDLIVCNKDGEALLIRQWQNGKFKKISLPNSNAMKYWRNARVADVTGDNVNDLIVVQGDDSGGSNTLFIFKGTRKYPFFNLRSPWYRKGLPFGAPDVEVLDVDEDGNKDIYVVQVQERSGYCGPGNANDWWNGGPQPPRNWKPPRDFAEDILLVGTGNEKQPFRPVKQKHSFPGCGSIVQKFGNNKTLLLGQGNPSRPGYNLLLEW